MARALDLLQQLGDVVQAQARSKLPEVPSHHFEGHTAGRGPSGGEPAPERVVDDLAKGPSGAPRFRLELGRDVVVQRQRGTHILMLSQRHHDVK